MTKKTMWITVKGETWDKNYELKSDVGVIMDNLLDKVCIRRTESLREKKNGQEN